MRMNYARAHDASANGASTVAEFFPALTEAHRTFVERQPVFFVATAAEGSRINLSPKGMDSFRVLDDRTVAYLDVVGSGNETNAHLIADGRITIMFCAFDQPALIFRIYGRGSAVLPQDDEWSALHAHFTPLPGTRQIFVIAIDQVQTSCGWGVPQMTLDRPRDTLNKYNAKYSDEERLNYWRASDGKSVDGLPTRLPDALPG
ncbi:pyridoxamine 5'-phosphate oxidase family protein [Sphingomonas sp. IC4-52]|uniref:pyridoxamine 5'-phosphate oxidase family protein n=1 Tax=Sphingomonas sp. IC4-52 TaxID=2887202 RepID=UPI001D10CA58|nr:pyridoxamine 5'-phosphate oxidase family protein [Sphingomonas sp. IC4-52]MCC2980598.1 pyridoxamine 5'-phosphate oxidase family protein [Sphingomonas sp. IC4-52]